MEKIKFGLLGHGGAFSSDERNINNSFFMTGGNRKEKYFLMIDCGEMNFHKVKSMIEKTKAEKLKLFVFVTHLHPDHIGGLTTLYFYMKIIRPDVEFKIFCSSESVKEKLKTVMTIMGADEKGTEETLKVLLKKEKVIEQKDTSIFFEGHRVKHSENMECFGYEINLKKSGENKTIWFSGDCSINQSAEVKDIIKKADIVFHEMTIHKVPVHTNVEDYLEVYPKETVEKTIPMHIGKKELQEISEILKERNFDLSLIENFYKNKRFEF